MIDVHYLTSDEFGAAIGAELRKVRGDASLQLQPIGLTPSRWPRARVQVVSMLDDGASEIDQIDALAFHIRRPWLPIVMRPRGFRVGPLVLPGLSGCYRCFRRRQYQHGRLNQTDRKIEARPRTNRDVPVSGFLPGHVSLAAQLVQADLDAVVSGFAEPRAGRLTTVRWLSLDVTTGRLSRVDGCERCGGVRSEDSTWRAIKSFADTLAVRETL